MLLGDRLDRPDNQEDGFKQAKRNLLFLDFVKLFPNMFRVTGSGPATRVSAR